MENRYTYEPQKIKECGKDRMRFELGDTMIEGGAETSALTDAEIDAMLELFPDKWKRAKLALLESICRRFAYEPDTKSGPLSFSFAERAKIWREDYEKLKKEVENGSAVAPKYGTSPNGRKRPPYFHVGMMENGEAKSG
jgi:hypothetical protein